MKLRLFSALMLLFLLDVTFADKWQYFANLTFAQLNPYQAPFVGKSVYEKTPFFCKAHNLFWQNSSLSVLDDDDIDDEEVDVEQESEYGRHRYLRRM